MNAENINETRNRRIQRVLYEYLADLSDGDLGEYSDYRFGVLAEQWEPDGIEYEHTNCICGVSIVHKCIIKNIITNNVAFVGNVCINRFSKRMGNAFECVINTQQRKNKNGKNIACNTCGYKRSCKCSKLEYVECSECKKIFKNIDIQMHKQQDHRETYLKNLHKDTKIMFGKYKNQKFSDVVPLDRGYFRWVLSNFGGDCERNIRTKEIINIYI